MAARKTFSFDTDPDVLNLIGLMGSLKDPGTSVEVRPHGGRSAKRRAAVKVIPQGEADERICNEWLRNAGLSEGSEYTIDG